MKAVSLQRGRGAGTRLRYLSGSRRLTGFLATLVATVFCGTSAAGPETWPYVEQLFVGIHDHATTITGSGMESGTDISIEGKFRAPRNQFWEKIGSPRPHLGGMVNLNDQTDQLYAGVTYRWNPYHRQFFDLSGGAAVHNGYLETDNPKRRSLGKRVLFRAAMEYGYEVTPEHGVSLSYDHISNGFLSGSNQGIDTVGVRYSYNMAHWVGNEEEHAQAQAASEQTAPAKTVELPPDSVYEPVDTQPAPATIMTPPIYLDERAVDKPASSNQPFTMH